MDERVNKDMAGFAAAIDYDAELMLRVKGGDDASFGVLLEKHRCPVIHFLYRMVQNQAVAEELGQEVFLRVFRSSADGRRIDDVSGEARRSTGGHRNAAGETKSSGPDA